jgi:hypothetical protein
MQGARGSSAVFDSENTFPKYEPTCSGGRFSRHRSPQPFDGNLGQFICTVAT